MKPPFRQSPGFFRTATARGFSLIEVAISLGILSFCIVGMVGLLAIGVDLGRVSSSTTSNAMIFEKVVNQLRVASIDRDHSQPGQEETDLYDLPPLGVAGGETTFTVDSNNRFLTSGASTAGDAVRVVNVKVLDSMNLDLPNMTGPQPLSTGGKLAFVRIEVKAAHGWKSGQNTALSVPTVFTTEINLLSQ